ncbi:hypothetical protein MA16_Dca015888 [Dendrobium catenatum]|uniref:Uncharacterized protein n=1 Tax=Dendrobium catenatum TaxID=906689 RepID=A0A2I0VMJ7_9ASPA|nr:hypothetical protein MA16_Dca015888 [Dendrobium catenatum]
MSRPNPFFLLSYIPSHSFEGLASRLAFLSIGTFQQRIPEYMIQVARPNIHCVGFTFFLFLLHQRIDAPLSSILYIPKLIESQVHFFLEGLRLQAVGPKMISSAHQWSCFSSLISNSRIHCRLE